MSRRNGGGAGPGGGDDPAIGGNAGAPSGVYPPMLFPTAPTDAPPGTRGTPGARSARPPVPSAVPRPSARRAPGGPPGDTADGGPTAPGRPAGARPAKVSPLRPDAAAPPVDGFSTFYRESWPRVARALAVALGDRDLAVEATDEAMARAYPRWSRLATYDNPGAWAYRVGLNWARSHRRRLARRPPVDHPTDEHLPPVGDPAVRAALLSLPLRQRSVVVCRLLLDWSVEDTAIALGVPPGTVQSRLHRALRSLHDVLDHLR